MSPYCKYIFGRMPIKASLCESEISLAWSEWFFFTRFEKKHMHQEMKSEDYVIAQSRNVTHHGITSLHRRC